MGCRFVLYGKYNKETAKAREVLEALGVSYRFEGVPEEDLDRPVILSTSGGRFRGLGEIRQVFGTEKSLEVEAKTV